MSINIKQQICSQITELYSDKMLYHNYKHTVLIILHA